MITKNKTLIMIPTYNERNNIDFLISKLRKLKKKFDILFIDDNSPDGTGQILDKMAVNNKRIKVSKRNNMQECLFATSGKVDSKIEFPYRKSGSAALDMAYIACGRYDGYFQRNLHLWDVAAGLIIVEEAGGMINKINLKDYKGLKIIASSPDINEKLMEKISNF